jgi:hypothetical protein
MNYRKIYAEYYGDIPKGFVIHHMDHNKKNNDIDNLIAIPISLHASYHALYNKIKYYDPKRMVRFKEFFIPTLDKFEKSYLKIIGFCNEQYN